MSCEARVGGQCECDFFTRVDDQKSPDVVERLERFVFSPQRGRRDPGAICGRYAAKELNALSSREGSREGHRDNLFERDLQVLPFDEVDGALQVDFVDTRE